MKRAVLHSALADCRVRTLSHVADMLMHVYCGALHLHLRQRTKHPTNRVGSRHTYPAACVCHRRNLRPAWTLRSGLRGLPPFGAAPTPSATCRRKTMPRWGPPVCAVCWVAPRIARAKRYACLSCFACRPAPPRVSRARGTARPAADFRVPDTSPRCPRPAGYDLSPGCQVCQKASQDRLEQARGANALPRTGNPMRCPAVLYAKREAAARRLSMPFAVHFFTVYASMPQRNCAGSVSPSRACAKVFCAPRCPAAVIPPKVPQVLQISRSAADNV